MKFIYQNGYSNADITNPNSGSTYTKVGGMIGSLTDLNEASLSIENSYHIGDIEHQEANEECGLLFGVLKLDSSSTVLKNIYGMGALTYCESNNEKATFGEENLANINTAVSKSNIEHLYGYNDNLLTTITVCR